MQFVFGIFFDPLQAAGASEAAPTALIEPTLSSHNRLLMKEMHDKKNKPSLLVAEDGAIASLANQRLPCNHM